uniref:Ig-like domain-containing protein n=1 Tax=Scleropages formosus TaxID=113540 RepID=A0A8C9TRZ6_SCLFO
ALYCHLQGSPFVQEGAHDQICLSCCLRLKDTCQCQQEVQINEPPLFRAQGSPLTISCTVINSRSSHEQQFDFVIYKKSAPERMVNIISTGDPSFPYADYSKRVRNGDIEVERLSSFSVLLHMKELLKEDDGDFECQTPNQLGTYLGSYSAKTTVNGIYFGPIYYTCKQCLIPLFFCSSFTLFPLTCLVLVQVGSGSRNQSRASVQHTVQKLCFGIMFMMIADTLSVSSTATDVTKTEGESLVFDVQVESPKGGVREGEVLQLKCTVEAQKIQERYFSVAWLKDGREVAHMDPRGVVSISQEYEARDREGEMKVWKSSNRDYVLFIKPVRVMDTGEYQCRVWKEEKGTGGVFTQGRSQDSSVERVAVTVPESNLVVTVPSAAVSVTQGSLLQLACQVSGAKGQVSVAWQHRSDKGTTVDVINLSRSGVMEPGAQYRQRVQAGNVRALRPTASNFTLEIANVLLTDSGVYRCTATDWVTERDDKVKNIDSKLQESTVSVVSLGKYAAPLKSRNVRVTENDTVELICTVKRPEAPLSVTWKFQPTGTPSQADIVLLTHNGDITWFKELRNYQLRVQAQAEETRVVLRIMRASASEAGAYQCVVDAFLQQVQTSRKLSNKLSVIVKSSLSIATGPQPLLEHDANSDVRMECRILKATSNSSRFAVTWQLQRPGEKNQTVVSMDHDSVLSDPGEAERYSLRRHDAQLFELLVPRVETRDSGQYHCLVEEWLQNSHGVWYSLPAKSDALELVVRSKRSNLEVSTAENEQVNVNCTMEAGSALPSSHYSVTWFFAKVNASAKETLGKVGHDGVLDTSGLAPELLERIRFYRPAIDTFSLTIQRVCVEDGGEYSCEVAEYQTDRDGNVMYIGSSKSGITNVRVLLPGTLTHLHCLTQISTILYMDSLEAEFKQPLCPLNLQRTAP